jgi:ABC-type multidrug transport system fused ATPase/permease subunit
MAVQLAVPPATRTRHIRRRRWPVSWPLAALLLGYPVWWAMGIGELVWTIFAVPMCFQMYRRRPVRLPPMFWAWGLFLALVAISSVMLNVHAADTIPSNTGGGNYVAYGLRLLNYVSVTLVMLYVGNLSEAELPRLRLIRWLSLVFVVTVLGGVAGTVIPNAGYDSPVKRFVPASLQGIDFVQQFTHIGTAQVQPGLGFPRPSAPFEYANAWGNNYSMLLVWFVIGWLLLGSTWRRVLGVALIALSVIPVVYAQNRGVWLGLGLGVGYVALRLALLRRFGVLMGMTALLVVTGAAVLVTPLQSVVTSRLSASHTSNDLRSSLSQQALTVAVGSPIIGYGSTRSTIGSNKSLAIGKSAGCPKCGNRVIGSTGQLWLVLVAQGYVGALLYLGFLGQGVVRYWRDQSLVGIGGTLILLLSIFYTLFYTAVVSPLGLTLISLALLWRNAEARRDQRAAEVAELRRSRLESSTAKHAALAGEA